MQNIFALFVTAGFYFNSKLTVPNSREAAGQWRDEQTGGLAEQKQKNTTTKNIILNSPT